LKHIPVHLKKMQTQYSINHLNIKKNHFMTIKITRADDKQHFIFEVANEKELTKSEVNHICNEMEVKAILVNGKIYKL